MIGTGGTSPFGAYGYNPQGIRIGQDKGRNRSAVKVWDQRAYKDYDDTKELGTRNIKVALRRLRRFAREGSELELDLDDTIHSTAANAGMLDIKMVPERHNKVKVLLLMDVGGTMDEHIHRVEELFSAAEDRVQAPGVLLLPQLRLRLHVEEQPPPLQREVPTWDVIRKYNKDYKLIFVGDATMSPYEILQPGGGVEYNNEEPGAEWLQRLTHAFRKYAWINPEPHGRLAVPASIAIVQQLMNQRMFPRWCGFCPARCRCWGRAPACSRPEGLRVACRWGVCCGRWRRRPRVAIEAGGAGGDRRTARCAAWPARPAPRPVAAGPSVARQRRHRHRTAAPGRRRTLAGCASCRTEGYFQPELKVQRKPATADQPENRRLLLFDPACAPV